jgi:hypothetical protein
MPFSDPEREQARESERIQALHRWRLLRDFFDYGNTEDWPLTHRQRFAQPLAVQRTLPGLLDRVEDGRLSHGRFKPTWLEWAESVAVELGRG